MTDFGPLRVLAVSGSLRQGSLNTAALRAAVGLAPALMTIELFADLCGIPPYDDDIKEDGFPPAVNDLRAQVRAADGLILATPEYNHGYSGVLKNAIDWVSRPPDQPFQDKPIALLSASPGPLGGIRGQYQLRQCFTYLDARLLSKPEVVIGNAKQKFAADLTLTDTETREFMTTWLVDFAAWINRIRSSRG